ncbi:DNA-binding transcriptional regulator, XRE-family HTH domain [Halobacillus alkaliphilus]|uniref:DNA-binding transcriptional regulator, XRE-family HTH domain n=1 Tax=Halobacillus alkaliphilus TaxID=396056 RepID=A0A1I2MD97_9BACI|nr:helix-turn-helix domain-containing protein [Halobacillus alkaliphilus]SFF88900.1 DNA-binding transcriptional regulator, XRE-family HTH domain [Halobacillus alkaliphilus]
MNFSDRLKRCRQIKKEENPNWTQDYIARKIGVARTTYTAYERGTKIPTLDTVNKIADLFDVSTDYLLGRSDISDNQVDKSNEFDSIKELNKLMDHYGIEDAAFFDLEKWKSMSPEQIRELESYFQYLVKKSKDLEK